MLTAEDREALAQMQLLARGTVEGLNAGRHRSQHRGASIEFKEHRQYVHGDEIRNIDWKLFGKTDRLYIRQYEDEMDLRSLILVDQSQSMTFRGRRTKISKHLFAVRLAACLATLMISQQDAVGLATFDRKLRKVIPVKSKPSHLRSIFETLVQSQPGEDSRFANVLKQSMAHLQRRGMLVVVSDCFGDPQELLHSLKMIRQAGNEVVVLQIWDRDELEFPYRDRIEFRGLEHGSPRRMLDAGMVRENYLKRLSEFRGQLSAGAARERIDWVECVTDHSYVDVLSRYLAGRSANINAKGTAAAVPRSSVEEQSVTQRSRRVGVDWWSRWYRWRR